MTANPARTSTFDAHHDGVGLSMRDYWDALLAQRWLIAGITLAILLLVLLASLLMPTLFRATSTLQIEREPMNVVNVESLLPVESPQDRDFYETQYELLRSRSLARAVIEAAGLADDAHFEALVPGAADGEAPARASRERALIGALLEGLEIEPVKNSRLVRIHYDATDPALAARVANAYGEAFIAEGQRRRLQASTAASEYLSDRLEQLQARVEDSEDRLVAYSDEARIVLVGADAPSLPAQNLADLNTQLAAAQGERIRAEAAWRQVGRGDGMALPQVVGNPLIQQLNAEQVRLRAEYTQKLATFEPGYPEMQRLQAQIEELRRQIEGQVVRIRESLRGQYEAAVRQETLMEERIDALMDEELDLQSRSIRYNLLKREVDTNRQLYDALLQRFKEIGVAGNVASNNISIIDRAETPVRPNSPNLALNLALAGVFGLAIAVCLALLRFLLRAPQDQPRTR